MTAPAIVAHMPAEQYHAADGLSASGMDDLWVSPLRYWHLHINPNRPGDEPTPFMQFGSALHCAVLEPTQFDSRYCERFNAEAIEGCLVTIGDLRAWLADRGFKPKGTLKADVIAQVLAVDPNCPIADVLQEQYDTRNEGKVQFKSEDWYRIGGAAQALRAEPALRAIMHTGEAEQSFFVEHPSGVLLKSRMDFVAPTVTLDLKTLSANRGLAFDKAVTNAIWYEGYYRKAYFYSLVRAIAAGKLTRSGPQNAPEFVLAFVESEEPHEVRIRSLRPVLAAGVNLLWDRARFEVESMIELYASCVRKFGDRPWREERQVERLEDVEFPALAYGG